MTGVVDRIVTLLKWPTGLLSLGLLPGVALGVFEVLGWVLHNPQPIMLFGIGFTIYYLVWLLFFRRRITGSLFSTFEHELTHAIFAWLTLHRVQGLKATWNSRGLMTFKGKGNWLIYLAPYFFPTLTVPIVIYLLVVHGATPEWVDALLGATMAYHITSTWRETHREQTDLKEVGFIFAFLFLPTANLAFFGAVLAFAHGGLGSSYQFLVTSFQFSDGLWSNLTNA